MFQLYRLQVSSLNVQEIKETLLLSNQIDLDVAKEGRQSDDSFILGQLVNESDTVVQNKTNRKQITLQEVKEDGRIADNKFEVFLYGKYEDNYSSSMESICIKNKFTCWILFRKVTLSLTHRRTRNPWNSYVITLSEEDNDGIIVSIINRQCNDSLYTDINHFVDKTKYNVFAVVVELMKDEQPTRQGNRHTLLAITDPTCTEFGGILLHVFFNKEVERLPCTIEKGNVIRITAMIVEFFADKPSGKVFSPFAIRIFKKEQGGLSVYSNKPYDYTKVDQEKVNELFSWSNDQQWMRTPEKDRGKEDSLPLRNLSEIDSHGFFDLECQIVKTKDVPERNVVQLRVVDGTYCQIWVNQLDFEDAARHLNSQTDKAVNKPPYIDIIVFRPLEDAQRLKPREFVRLINIQCSEISDVSMNATDPIQLFDFQMDGSAKILPLDHNSGSVRDIQRRIKAKCNGEEAAEDQPDSQNSLLKFAQLIANAQYSEVFGSNTMNSTGLTAEKSPKRSMISEIPYSVTNEKLEFLIGRGGSSDTSDAGPTAEKSPQRTISEIPNSVVNEKLEIGREGSSDISDADTLVYDITSNTLKEYLSNKNNMQPTHFQLSIQSIMFLSIVLRPKGGIVSNLVWGLCPMCGAVYSSVALRESFLSIDLATLQTLICVQCKGGKKSKSSVDSSASVMPYFAAKFILCDPKKTDVTVEVYMTGDDAIPYFGINPSFKFVLDNEAEDLRAVLWSKFKKNTIIELNLVRRDASQDIYVV